MTVKMIRQTQANISDVITYNVPLDHPKYDPLEIYADGAKVLFGDNNQDVYKSIAGSNSGNQPDASLNHWVKVGVSNFWALFDDSVSTQTTNAESIEIEVSINKLTNAVALINIYAQSARFELWDLLGDKIVDKTVSLRNYGAASWHDYYFEPITTKQNFVTFDVPALAVGRGKLTLNAPGDTVRLGLLIYGAAFNVGRAGWGLSLGIKDFSGKGTDVFGNTKVIRRGYKSLLDVNVSVDRANIGNVARLLAEYRSIPVVWSIDEGRDYTIVFGIHDFRLVLPHGEWADCSLKIEGMI